MKRIWKVELPIQTPKFAIKTPMLAMIRHVAMQGDKACLWFEFQDGPTSPLAKMLTGSPNFAMSMRVHWFKWFGTGDAIPEQAQYVATVLPHPALVLHLYAVTEHDADV